MSSLDRSRKVFLQFDGQKLLYYGCIGIVSAIVIQVTIGFATDHLLLLILSIIFWILFSSSIAWTFWEVVLPIVGQTDPPE